jgi:AcrR family transcriptional regulator
MSASAPVSGRAGRRRGSPDTRASILLAARGSFAEKGFDKTSMRGVAKLAGVDPALVHHYFESKDDLMLAALDVPIDLRLVIGEVTGHGLEGLGERIITRFLQVWDDEQLRTPMLAVLRASTSSEQAAELFRAGLVRMVLESISAAIDADDAMLRAQAVASQLLGLIMVRYVLRLEPLASTPAADLVPRFGATLQRYLEDEYPPKQG